MRIKPLNTERKPVDVSEWNDEIKAFFRPLGGFDTMVFVDFYFDWRDDSKSLDDRFKAGFKAALLTLVDEEGNALLTEEDEEAIRAASFDPIYRVFSIGLGFWSQNGEEEPAGAKKNSETTPN